MNAKMNVQELLKRPYSRTIVPEEDGTYRAEIAEFPGCIATGETPADAFFALERAAESWLEGVLENGLPIPEPAQEIEYSGKFVLRLPKTLHQRAAYAAKHDGVSLNQFITVALAAYLGPSASQRVPQAAYNFSNFTQNTSVYFLQSGVSASLGKTNVPGITAVPTWKTEKTSEWSSMNG